MDEPSGTGNNGDLVSHSFVIRALLEPEGTEGEWYGFVTDAATGERVRWRRPVEALEFIQRRLSASPQRRQQLARSAAMSAPPLTDVITEMLAALGDHLPGASPPLPDPNVTIERVAERLLGLGNHRGTEEVSALAPRTLKGGWLEARVRFQLWGATVAATDDAVLALHADLLDARDALRTAGFLKLKAAETTLAERVDSEAGWRKATSFDVLYEYQYVDSDDADSLIARLHVTTDPEQPASPAREVEDITDDMVRWDNEAAPSLTIRGPATIRRISALVFAPVALGGTVTVLRASGVNPPAHLPDLPSFLAATGGEAPAQTDADVSSTPAVFFTELGATGGSLALGDWDVDGAVDSYEAFDHVLDQPILLRTQADRLVITYAPPPGPATGLDQTAVVYLRANRP
jgi:hypothetical protein